MNARTKPCRRFELVAFDWDGTLYDSTAVIVRCIQHAVRDVGGIPPDETTAAYVIGMSLRQALAHAAPDVAPSLYDELARRYNHHYRLHHSDLVLFPGVIDMLRRLKQRGHIVTVATGKSRRGLDEALASVQLQGLFDGSRTADETASKPDPLMLQELMAQFQVAPERTLMIGDTSHDLNMARAAGCASVAVSYGAHPALDLAESKPLFIADSVALLDQWLEQAG